MKQKGDHKMTTVGTLLARYRNVLKAPERTVITTTIEIIKDLYGFDIHSKTLRYSPQSRTITVVASGALKNEIILHKREILQHLKGRLGVSSAPKDII